MAGRAIARNKYLTEKKTQQNLNKDFGKPAAYCTLKFMMWPFAPGRGGNLGQLPHTPKIWKWLRHMFFFRAKSNNILAHGLFPRNKYLYIYSQT